MRSDARERDFSCVGLFPLPNVVLLPHQLLPLHVFESRYRALVADALESGRLIGIPQLEPGFEADCDGAPSVKPVFGVGEIHQHQRLPDGRYYVIVRGLARVRLLREHQATPFRTAEVELLEDLPSLSNLAPLRAEVTAAGERLLSHLEPSARRLSKLARSLVCDAAGSDYLAADLIHDPDERQALLEQRDPAARLSRLLEVLGGLADHIDGAELDAGVSTSDRRWN